MIHILCLNWNGESLLDPFLNSLLENLQDYEHNIHIRDNGSKDGSLNILEKYPVQIHSINHNRDSFSTGINFLFEKANPSDEDFVLLINNDIEFKTNDNINQMISLINKTNAGIIGAKLFYPNNTLSHYGVVMSQKYGNLPWNYKSGCKSNKYDKYHRSFQAVTAACCLFKAKTFSKVNGLSTDYKWCFEDVDFSLKVLINEQLPVICCGTTNIVHGTSVSLKKNPVNKMFMQHNVRAFKEAWYGKYKIDHHLYEKNNMLGVVGL